MTPLDLFLYVLAAIGGLILGPLLIPLAVAIIVGGVLLILLAIVRVSEWLEKR